MRHAIAELMHTASLLRGFGLGTEQRCSTCRPLAHSSKPPIGSCREHLSNCTSKQRSTARVFADAFFGARSLTSVRR